MASPQPNQHTRISNELLEQIYRFPFTSYEFRVMLFILRMTYGYQRKVVRLTTQQIADGTNIHKSNICRVLRSLLLSNQLQVVKSTTKKGQLIGIQKDYEKWKKKRTVVESTTNRCRSNNKSGIVPFIVKEKRKEHKKEKKLKEKKQPTNNLPPLDVLKSKYAWLDIELWSKFREHRKNLFKSTKKHPYSEVAETLALSTLRKYMDEGYKQSQIINPSIISGWAGLFKPKEEPQRDPGDW